MKPKEKARQLVNRFVIEIDYDSVSNVAWRNPMDEKEQIRTMKDAKRYALIVVEEMLNSDKENEYPEYDFNEHKIGCDTEYWQKVKTEIEKL